MMSSTLRDQVRDGHDSKAQVVSPEKRNSSPGETLQGEETASNDAQNSHGELNM